MVAHAALPFLGTNSFAVSQSFRYLRHTMPLWAVLIRVVVFISCAVSMWVMFPGITKSLLHSDAKGQGLIMAFLGAGAAKSVGAGEELFKG